MPILAMIYILVVCFAVADTLSGNLADRRPVWYTSFDLASAVVLLLLFAGYWVKGIVESMGLLAPCLFVFSVTWEICTAGHGLERSLRRVSSNVRSLVRKVLIGLEVTTAFIGYWFGGIAVLRTL